MKRPSIHSQARQSARDANLRKSKGRAAHQAIFGNWQRRVKSRASSPVVLSSPFSAAAVGMAIGRAAISERMIVNLCGTPEEIERFNRENYPDTMARLDRLRGRL